MKSFFSLSIGFCILVSFAGLDFRTLEIKIEDKSKISIQGTSNVNSFQCVYEEEISLVQNTIEFLPKSESFEVKKAQLNLEAKSFDCGGRRINRDFNNLLKSDAFPHVHIKILTITPYGKSYLADVEVHIAGHTKRYQIEVVNPEKNQFLGELILDITDFNLESPKKLMGLIKVDDLINIHFNMYIQIDA
jgi:hypothetical protein